MVHWRANDIADHPLDLPAERRPERGAQWGRSGCKRRTTMDTPPILALTAGLAVMGLGGATSLAPATMARIDTVDERYQSYNVEMIEATGGEFWKPYGAKPDTPGGMNPGLYQY